MPWDSGPYTIRFTRPHEIERGVTTVLEAPVYRDGDLVEPSSGTVTIYDAAGTALVSAAAVTVSGAVAVYSVSSGTTAAWTLEAGGYVVWALVVDGATLTARNESITVRRIVRPVITDFDLSRRVPALDLADPNRITIESTYQDYIDESWADICLRLIRMGNRPNLVASPSELREVHLFGTLYLIFDNLATRLNAAYVDQAARYRRDYETAFATLSLTYDTDDDNQVDQRRRGPPTIWLTGR